MAKTSMVEREKKRARMIAKYAKKRAELKAIINDRNLPDEERWIAQEKLQKLPRNASPVRKQRRCGLTGRPLQRVAGAQAAALRADRPPPRRVPEVRPGP